MAGGWLLVCFMLNWGPAMQQRTRTVCMNTAEKLKQHGPYVVHLVSGWLALAVIAPACANIVMGVVHLWDSGVRPLDSGSFIYPTWLIISGTTSLAVLFFIYDLFKFVTPQRASDVSPEHARQENGRVTVSWRYWILSSFLLSWVIVGAVLFFATVAFNPSCVISLRRFGFFVFVWQICSCLSSCLFLCCSNVVERDQMNNDSIHM